MVVLPPPWRSKSTTTNWILALRKEAFHASVISLKLDGKAETVVLRDAQMHPYKALVLHADFQRVDTTHAIHQKGAAALQER